MENIYHDYWQQELAYQFLAEDKCRKRAYICSPYSADKQDEILQNMYAARAYMYYAMKRMNMNASAPHAFLPMLLCDEVPSERALALKFGLELLEKSEVMLVCGTRLSNGHMAVACRSFFIRKRKGKMHCYVNLDVLFILRMSG